MYVVFRPKTTIRQAQKVTASQNVRAIINSVMLCDPETLSKSQIHEMHDLVQYMQNRKTEATPL